MKAATPRGDRTCGYRVTTSRLRAEGRTAPSSSIQPGHTTRIGWDCRTGLPALGTTVTLQRTLHSILTRLTTVRQLPILPCSPLGSTHPHVLTLQQRSTPGPLRLLVPLAWTILPPTAPAPSSRRYLLGEAILDQLLKTATPEAPLSVPPRHSCLLRLCCPTPSGEGRLCESRGSCPGGGPEASMQPRSP